MAKLTSDSDSDQDEEDTQDKDAADQSDREDKAPEVKPATKKPARRKPAAPAAAAKASAPSWLAPVALVVAVVAVGVAAWTYVNPPRESTPTPTAQETSESRADVCAAFNTVRSAVALQTHADIGREPAAVQAIAANARLAMSSGGAYLLASLTPATPPELADAARAFAKGLQDISINALAGVKNEDPAQSARLQDTEAASKRVADLCK